MVSSVVNFGAFVDLGGMDGLVHVSELSWKHVDHPSSVVSVGDEVEVEVLDVDLDKERISLSLKATQTDPWQEFANTHQVGELVYGRITKLVPFGAFVQVGDGIEGLVHISEMAGHHVDLPEQVVTPGEELWVKIIDIDLQRRRISLSIKQAAEGGEVSEEYREAFGEHAYDAEGNYIGLRLRRGRVHPRDRGPGGVGRVRGRARHPARVAKPTATRRTAEAAADAPEAAQPSRRGRADRRGRAERRGRRADPDAPDGRHPRRPTEPSVRGLDPSGDLRPRAASEQPGRGRPVRSLVAGRSSADPSMASTGGRRSRRAASRWRVSTDQREVARHEVAGRDLAHLRLLVGAALLGVGAAGAEPASRRRD